MSTNNYILNLLNIKDTNIHILTDKLTNKVIKGKTFHIIEAILTYNPEFCPCCGCINESSNDIIKWGFRKNCIVKIPKVSNCKTRLLLHKQRFYCKNCNNTFIAETNLVGKNKNISNNSELQIRLELMKKQSEKDIADRLDVSVSKIDKVLNDISSHTILRHSTLPKSMNWDEFKATKDTKGKMAFIIVDNKTGNIFDIQNSRKSRNLEKYFRRYSRSERNKVKLISTDFFSGYIKLAEKLFKNADIVIDRFHIVTQVYVALNKTRISLCNKSNPNYNKLKDYWKLLLKNENELSEEKKYSNHFRKYISQKEIVTYLINTNHTLKATYECYQGIINSLKEKDFNKFKQIIENQNNNISDKMKQAIKLYNENIKYIENSFRYEINNGTIEGTNNLIKTLKRIAFGYRKYEHFVSRIFLIKGRIKE
ncbi:MAG: ISL3 family transposase [Candidatus Faecimonas sp.]|nr:ISL3 family transposase [Mycoplasmatota bacterium]MDY2907892.1 ISL3 family transposase [Candidatus Faecimonas sp.]